MQDNALTMFSKEPCGVAVRTARSEIWRAINAGRCGSATVAIMVDGTIIYAEGFGMADREKSIPVDANTLTKNPLTR